jgi:uncharacterized membrane protein
MPNLPFPPPIWIILGPVLLLAALSLLVPLLTKERQRPPEEGWNGIFYSNPDDPALFVPKRYGIGYTINFGNRWCWLVLASIFAMLVAPLLLTTFFLHRLPR